MMEIAKMKRKGFTLIELMVVLAIIVIIATASVPKVQVWTARNRGVTAVSQIISEISKAKSIAAYSVNNTGVDGAGNYTRVRPETAIMFRGSSYSILQRTGSTDWPDVSPLKQTALPLKVSIVSVNGDSANNLGNTPTLIFTSTGRVKKTDNALVPLGINGSLECGDVGNYHSPLNGRRVFNLILKSEIDEDSFFWYRIEIDTAGEFLVCMEPGDASQADFKGASVNLLEL